MRIPDQFVRAVAFLAILDDGAYKFAGTAFFVTVPSEADAERAYLYLVSARHVIEGASRHGSVHLRLNRRDRPEAAWVDLTRREWFFPDDLGVDLAISPFEWPNEVEGPIPLEYRHIPMASFLTEAVANEAQIGVGDDIFVPGMYPLRPGRARNAPIVRIGSIAAMPGELLVDQDTALEYEAYLLEMRSLPGLSGSPVLIAVEGSRLLEGLSYRPDAIRVFLLGVVKGHWDLRIHDTPMDDGSPPAESVNTGIAMGVPVLHLESLLMDARHVRERRNADRAIERTPTP